MSHPASPSLDCHCASLHTPMHVDASRWTFSCQTGIYSVVHTSRTSDMKARGDIPSALAVFRFPPCRHLCLTTRFSQLPGKSVPIQATTLHQSAALLTPYAIQPPTLQYESMVREPFIGLLTGHETNQATLCHRRAMHLDSTSLDRPIQSLSSHRRTRTILITATSEPGLSL